MHLSADAPPCRFGQLWPFFEAKKIDTETGRQRGEHGVGAIEGRRGQAQDEDHRGRSAQIPQGNAWEEFVGAGGQGNASDLSKSEEQRTEDENGKGHRHHDGREQPQVLLGIGQGAAGKRLLHVVLVEAGHDHSQGSTTDQLLPEKPGGSPVAVEDRRLGTLREIPEQVRRAPVEAHH